MIEEYKTRISGFWLKKTNIWVRGAPKCLHLLIYHNSINLYEVKYQLYDKASAPGGTRTLNLSVRSALLYPIELPGQAG